MGKITELTIQKKNRKRVSVFVDGEFLTGLESIVVASRGLKVGDEVDEQLLLELSYASLSGEAFDKALHYISVTLRTEREIRDFLKKKEYPEKIIDDTVKKLYKYNYLNDEAYVKSYLSCYAGARGVLRIKMELINKGVDKNLVERALAELDGQDEAALEAAKKYVRTHKDYDNVKLSRFLYSRGFDYSAISYAKSRLGVEDEDD